MKYWRKMLLALFAVCLFAGMGFSADLSSESICDPDCFDGLMFIGDMFYDGCMPDMDDDECSVLNWPLDGALWDCDNAQFINQGFAWLDAQTYGTDDVRGLLPHRLAWSESQHLMFVSYITPWSDDPDSAPWIDIFDLDNWRSAKFTPFTYGDGGESEYEVGAMALDDERGLLYVTNLDKDDARLSIWDINGLEDSISAGPTKVDTPDEGFTICCESDCECEFSHNMDIIYFQDRLYVTYYDSVDYGSWMIGVFDADPDSDTYGHSVKCFPLICDNADSCGLDPQEGKFPASELAAGTWTDSSGEEHVLLFASFHPDYKGRDCYSEPDNTDCPWIKEMAGTLAVIDPEEGELLGVENFNDLSSKVYDFGLCDTDEWFDLRSIAWNPCACDETCQDGLLYVTAMKYGPTEHCHDADRSVCEVDMCHKHDVALESYVLAFSFKMEDCNTFDSISLEGMKTLPVREVKCETGKRGQGCAHHECYENQPWSPADIVATQWVPQIAVDVDVPLTDEVFQGGTVTVTYEYDGDEDKNATDNPLGMTLQYDPTLLSVDETSVVVTLGDVSAPLGEGFVTGDEGQVTFQNLLSPVSGTLSAGDTIVVEVSMGVVATSTEETSVLAYFDDPIGGYSCCMTYGASSTDDDCPDIAYDPCDGVTLTELAEDEDSAVDPVIGAFTLEASDTECCTSGDLCIYVNTEYDGTPGLWQFDGTDWTAVSTDVTEGATFEDCSFDYQLCVTIDPTEIASVDEWAVVEAGYGDPGDGDDTDDEIIVDDDDNGTEAGGESDDDDSSSGCNVGFSAAALLFAVPLVSIFRKR